MKKIKKSLKVNKVSDRDSDSDNILSSFKSYDIRGKLGDELNEYLAYKVGYAVAKFLQARNVVVGYDARESSPALSDAILQGICDYGANALLIGLAGSEEVYAAVSNFEADAGIEVTASHNPIEYNGFKIVKNNSQPLTEKEFLNLKSLVANFVASKAVKTGAVLDVKSGAQRLYIDKVLNFVNINSLKPLKIVVNSGNGAAGPTIDKLITVLEERGVKVDFIKVHHNPDSDFPNGIPNPALKENHFSTSDVVKQEEADFGVAFDGDFDRCFFFDNLGQFVQGQYIVGILAEVFLTKESSSTIIHDPRLIWNTLDIVDRLGGYAVMSQTGHSFFKSAMHKEFAIYGGELSAHHYFRDFFCCDSGMIPWLIIWELLSKKGFSLSEIISDRRRKFPSSGELNFKIKNPEACLQRIKETFLPHANSTNYFDGISATFDKWRFNLRKSNTEPLVRLNVESRGDQKLLNQKTEELTRLILNELQ